MNLRLVTATLVLVLACIAPAAWAQTPNKPDPRPAWDRELSQIQAQRRQLQADSQRDEAACYQRFAVQDCLNAVRKRVRTQELGMDAREREIDLAERQWRAEQRRASVLERQQEHEAGLERAGERAIEPKVRATPEQAAERQAESEQQAAGRASAQSQRRAQQAGDAAERRRALDERAEQARTRQQEKIERARERQQERARKQADAAKRQAAPLPRDPQLPPASTEDSGGAN